MSPIAIIGISTELPAGDGLINLDHHSFFQFLLNKGDAIEKIPSDRLNISSWFGHNPGQINTDSGAFLKGIDLFDNVEFGISSVDAHSMAPASKRLLENVFLALLDSGIDYRARNVGCFTSGVSFSITDISGADEFEAKGSFAGYPSMVANRISTHLDLLGPSLPTDTACSSTLTAFHLAVQAISTGECESAVVAGCQLNHRYASVADGLAARLRSTKHELGRFIDWVSYSQGSLLSSDGRCKPFDSKADGFARGEGCVAIVIKPLDAAMRDHDHVYAVTLGTAINSSGGAAPPGAPVAVAQRDAMLRAFERSDRASSDVDYVELHATGTAKGDPTEANWVGEYFYRNDDLIIGSVKANIGHTEIVAFLASLSKVLAMFETKTIPPQINIHSLNPAIEWDKYNLRVALEATPLPCRANRPLIAMASSGIGGSNGHAVLEGPPPVEAVEAAWSPSLVVLMASGLSSRSTASVEESLRLLVTRNDVNLYALSTVLGRRARQMAWRSYAIVDPTSLVPLAFSASQHCSRKKNSVVLLFSGQGPQHVEMGRALFAAFPIFRRSIMEMDETFKHATGKSIIIDYGLFGAGLSTPPLRETWPISLILPSIAMFQIALFDLLVSLGVRPDIIIGHSAGETSAMYASGAAPKALSVELAVLRGKAFSSMESLGGTMAALACSPEDVQALIGEVLREDNGDVLEIACYNSPSAVAVAGHERAIDCLLREAQAQGHFCRKIRTHVPIHSSLMEHCRHEYVNELRALFRHYPGPHVPLIKTYSTLTGGLFEGPYDASYFWLTTRKPVRFTEAMESITASPSTIIEVSPHPVLASYVSHIMQNGSHVFASTRRHQLGQPPTECHNLLTLCAQLTSVGHNFIDFTTLNGKACYDLQASLPKYPFVKKVFPLYPNIPSSEKPLERHNGPLNHRHLKINKQTHPVLAEHVIRGEPIMPAAGFVEMALEFGATGLMGIDLRAILSLSSDQPTSIDVRRDGAQWRVMTEVPSKVGEHSLRQMTSRVHAEGYLTLERAPPSEKLDINAIRQRCPSHVGSSFYTNLEYFSKYGPRFRRVTNVYYGYEEALVSIRGMDHALERDGRYRVHPAILDACIQVTAFKPFHGNTDPNSFYLPAHIDAVVLHQSLVEDNCPCHVYAHVVLKQWTPASVFYDIEVLDDWGHSLCSIKMLEVAKHQIHPPPDVHTPFCVSWQRIFPQKSLASGVGMRSAPSKEVVQDSPTRAEDVLAYLLKPYCDALQDAISSSDKKIVRVYLWCKDDDIVQFVINSLKHSCVPFVELHISFRGDHGHRNWERGTIRVSSIDVASSNTPLASSPDEWFDVVSGVVHQNHTDTRLLVQRLGDLLIPDGALILTVPANTGHDSDSVPTNEAAPHILSEAPSYGDLTIQDTVWTSMHGTLHVMLRFRKALLATAHHSLFDPSKSLVTFYAQGHEASLQSTLAQVDPQNNQDVWIASKIGRDGCAALGLVRALRREFPFWKIRLVLFPATDNDRDSIALRLGDIPSQARDELDILIEPSGIMMVPRLVPLEPLTYSASLSSERDHLQPEGSQSKIIRINQQSYSCDTALTCVFGTGRISSTEDPQSLIGFFKARSAPHSPQQVAICSQHAIAPLPSDLHAYSGTLPIAVSGILIAILAQGITISGVAGWADALRVLVTHSDTAIGVCICRFYQSHGISFSALPASASLLEIGGMSNASKFNVIISGHRDPLYLQVLASLLSASCGRLFRWADETGDLTTNFLHSPWIFQDALQVAVSFFQGHAKAIHEDVLRVLPPAESLPNDTMLRGGATLGRDVLNTIVCNKQGTYLIVGGVGSIGVHVAWLLYQRGARHIILTSRRGVDGLRHNSNLLVRRMTEYLQSREDLNIHIDAVDSADHKGMNALVERLSVPLTACFILTSVLYDRKFQDLTTRDFDDVFDAKVGVVEALCSAVDLASLEFVVAFSSVVGLFGNGGQANYGGANTAMEEELSHHPNTFSFICPGIVDSTLMLAGRDASQVTHLNQFADWGMTMEEMLLWLEDALFRFQQGQRFSRYVPSIDWTALDRTLGMPIVGKHLLSESIEETRPCEDDVDRMSSIICSVLSIHTSDFSTDTPLTAYGVDSLSAARLSFLLRPIVEISQLQLLANVTFNDLKEKLRVGGAPLSMMHENMAPTGNTNAEEQMMRLLETYSVGLDAQSLQLESGSKNMSSLPDEVVLITGSTGTLGCNLLVDLLRRPEVKRVYALNRKNRPGEEATILDRQTRALERQGFSASLAESARLTLIEYDLAQPHLAIDSAAREKILREVTHIIHNAWLVDFYSGLSMFEDLIAGTRHLLDLATKSKRSVKPSFSYISTVAVSRCPTRPDEPVPEEPLLDPSIAVESGYSESKWVAERLVQLVGERASLKTRVIRTGLLSGGANGRWGVDHWLPALVQSAEYLNCLPDGDDDVFWLPIDVAAAAIVDLRNSPSGVFHLVHPRPAKWSTIMGTLASLMKVPLVPYPEWLARLESHDEDDIEESHRRSKSALRLVYFFKIGISRPGYSPGTESMGLLPRATVNKGVASSAAMQGQTIEQIGAKEVQAWVAYWRSVGFLH